MRPETLHRRPERREGGRDHRDVVDRHGLEGREPHDEKAHRDPVIHVGRDHSAAARPAAFDDQIVALDGAIDAGGAEPGGDRGQTIYGPPTSHVGRCVDGKGDTTPGPNLAPLFKPGTKTGLKSLKILGRAGKMAARPDRAHNEARPEPQPIAPRYNAPTETARRAAPSSDGTPGRRSRSSRRHRSP